ncbi:hypothetical protein M9Y10_037339 [Tritrichomonas musculus]|uniref:PARP catalytic domain-containing protein n=1 Tax=Tritrichomonas musculus TaxID=1915356 RepID=A0ABR2GSG0_9EUKA
MSRSHKSSKPYRKSLIHQTDLACAEQIISTQTMRPGAAGLYGPGIYFANTIEATNLKAHRRGVYLIADVYLGKVKHVTKNEATSGNFNVQQIQAEGYTSIFGYKMPTGREIIVFDPNRVKNIKFIYGSRPRAVFQTDRERIVLFLVTDRNTAGQIVETQKVPKIDGPFGRGCYLFDSITDALAMNPNQETYLAADAYMVDFYNLQNGENTNSPNARNGHRSFLGKHNGINHFILKNRRNVVNIHFCGGKPWS